MSFLAWSISLEARLVGDRFLIILLSMALFVPPAADIGANPPTTLPKLGELPYFFISERI